MKPTTTSLVLRFLSLVMLLMFVLLFEQLLYSNVQSVSVHRHHNSSFAVEDEAIPGRSVKSGLLLLKPAVVSDEHLSAVVIRPSIPSTNARRILLFRQVSTALSLHLLFTQITSSAT